MREPLKHCFRCMPKVCKACGDAACAIQLKATKAADVAGRPLRSLAHKARQFEEAKVFAATVKASLADVDEEIRECVAEYLRGMYARLKNGME